MAGFTRTVPKMTVRVDAHHIKPRFDVEELEIEVYTSDRSHAIRTATYVAARQANIPGWKPWLREVARHAHIVRVEKEEVKIG